MLKLISATILIFISFVVFSHAEHDKPRYVANSGVDQGRCDKVTTPCKTIGYAAEQSNKGDVVYVASGDYYIESASDIFYITSSLVKVKGGYSTSDGFKSQNTKVNVTLVHGVAPKYHQVFVEKGLVPNADSKAMSKEKQAELNSQISAASALTKQQQNLTCIDGVAGDFECNNMSLVSHVPLENMSEKPTSANDVWGHVDLNTNKEYAIIGVKNGTVVFDISEPSEPVEVGYIVSQLASWRDIKVYQYYDEGANRWFAYAFVSTDGANDGIAIIDLNKLPESAELIEKNYTNSSAHNIYISNVDYSTGVPINDYIPRLHVLGSSDYGGAHRSHSLENVLALNPEYIPRDKTRSDYSHDGTSMIITGDRVQDQCDRSGAFCDVFIDFNENELRLWDQTVPSETKELGHATYTDAQYVHSGWWSEDKQYIFLHDEQDEQYNGINTTLYVFNVKDVRTPKLVGRWTGPTGAIDHNGYVRGNRYYMSNYEKGITVLDITDPEEPVQIGFFDTFPIRNNTSFNGAWGVYPFLPSGLILASDINSGLYILTDDTRNVSQGKVQFAEASYGAEEGESVTFVVERVDGSTGNVSVDYRSLQMSANGSDFTESTGTLTWEAGNSEPKEISVLTTLDTELETKESFMMTLFNVQGGLTLGQHRSSEGVIDGSAYVGSFAFESSTLELYEGIDAVNGQTEKQIKLTRSLQDSGPVSITIGIDSSTAENAQNEIILIEDTVTWEDGELGDKFITISLADDNDSESIKEVVLSIESYTPSDLIADTKMTITVFDDESNQAPNFDTVEFSAELFSMYNMAARIKNLTDEQSNRLSYRWEILSGPSSAYLRSENILQALFNADEVGSYEVRLTVTDIFGLSTSKILKLNVVAQATDNGTVSGTVSASLLTLVLGLVFIRRTRQNLIKH
ncbi:choice-of-anchor B family protein [Psychrosphaera haliotis]|uniref:Choice-of-anchor B family protein n=1 Tax=Psychrosphaera haliotis TaxID=555083 RepID=A0A6N8FAJ5_9GAMM|nr:choice-of-anchor B family protein [Psychrosphaera haliotis]MUH73635.1 choice-of-anchor B family protein [Psychrosphaera haliotis]